MSTEEPTNTDVQQNRIAASSVEKVRVEEEMKQSYIDYAMSVIEGRSLPDVRDGLKPVHRRILYTMYENNITNSSGMRKCADTVGKTMGGYHPHGDQSIYDALVRMAQDFSMRYPLIDEQGNFGSIDGDPPAAMRYTEARMSKLSESLLNEIGDDTVDMESNYDGRMEEPSVLPSAFPNLLVNGSMGIAVGMSTKIPPHNLTEVINATIHYIKNPDCTVEELMEYVSGPDFPTGGQIIGRDGIQNAYKTGKGKVRVRASYHIEDSDRGNREQIVVDEIPYNSKKAKIIEKIADLSTEQKIQGIHSIRDESDRDGMRVVIEVKSNSITEVVANQLIDTVLEKTFGVINLALVDGKPEVLNLKEMIKHYVNHRYDVTRRKMEHKLEDAQAEEHLLEGRFTALRNADSVVSLIQDSADRDDAIASLQTEYEMTETQAEHVVRMQLGSLTSLEMGELEDNYESVQTDIEYYELILNTQDEMDQLLIDDLADIRDKFGDERRTEIVTNTNEVTNEDLIPEEESYYFVSDDGYVKRTDASEFRKQNRGGKGVIGTSLKKEDTVSQVVRDTTHTNLYFFTNYGNVYSLRGHQIPKSGRNARGTPVINLLKLDENEEISYVTSQQKTTENTDALLIGTKNGYIKLTDAEEFDNIYPSGLRAVSLEDGDSVIAAEFVDTDNNVLLSSSEGRSIRFTLDDIRMVGRNTKGVNGMKLPNGSNLVSVTVLDETTDQTILSVTENGFGRRTAVTNYRLQSRYGKGILDVNTGERNGDIVKTVAVTDDDTVSFATEEGQVLETSADEISIVGRNTKGVKLMDISSEDAIVEVTKRS